MADNVTELKKTNGKSKLPARKNLMDLHRSSQGVTSSLAELRGEMAGLLKNAENDQNVHKGAFKLASKLKRMDDEKRDNFLIHFDHYRKEMGIDEGRTAQMFDENKTEAEAEVEEDEGDDEPETAAA